MKRSQETCWGTLKPISYGEIIISQRGRTQQRKKKKEDPYEKKKIGRFLFFKDSTLRTKKKSNVEGTVSKKKKVTTGVESLQ